MKSEYIEQLFVPEGFCGDVILAHVCKSKNCANYDYIFPFGNYQVTPSAHTYYQGKNLC